MWAHKNVSSKPAFEHEAVVHYTWTVMLRNNLTNTKIVISGHANDLTLSSDKHIIIYKIIIYNISTQSETIQTSELWSLVLPGNMNLEAANTG